jgi:asparagine synthase (glutamine-hydrolysing)
VELGLSLPDHLKVNGGWSKFALRQAIAGLVPDSVRWRKTKLGFAAPERGWLMSDLREPINQLLAGSLRSERYLNVSKLRQWYHASRTAPVTTESLMGIFRILSLEMWMRAFAV